MFGVRKAAREFVDVLQEVQRENDRLKAENAKLRKDLEFANNEWEKDSIEFLNLQAENAKLRELVADMHAVISERNTWWDCMCKDTRRFADRTRELGIEVTGK